MCLLREITSHKWVSELLGKNSEVRKKFALEQKLCWFILLHSGQRPKVCKSGIKPHTCSRCHPSPFMAKYPKIELLPNLATTLWQHSQIGSCTMSSEYVVYCVMIGYFPILSYHGPMNDAIAIRSGVTSVYFICISFRIHISNRLIHYFICKTNKKLRMGPVLQRFIKLQIAICR